MVSMSVRRYSTQTMPFAAKRPRWLIATKLAFRKTSAELIERFSESRTGQKPDRRIID
jgi:hypothetical protein